jgi:molybdate transport repressor ModE-like protein
MDNWNDLKLVLAIHRAGSLGGGAKALGINHSTVFRRLNALEEKIGVRLFERLPGGVYEATSEGERVATTAERIETEADALSRHVAGGDKRLTGALRVTSSETLAYSALTSELARFREAHPGIVVELVVDNRVLSLSRREADIALRVTRPKEPDLFGRKLADIAWTIYAAPRLLALHGPVGMTGPMPDLPFIGWGPEVSGIAAADWLDQLAGPRQIVYRASSLINQFTAAKAGIGFVVLPCYLGDTDPGLVRALDAPLAELTRELWIVTHADLRNTARVRAFLDIVGEGLAARQELFGGRRA